MIGDLVFGALLRHQGSDGTGAGGPAKVLETTCKLEPIGKGVNCCTLFRRSGTVIEITVTTALRLLLLHQNVSVEHGDTIYYCSIAYNDCQRQTLVLDDECYICLTVQCEDSTPSLKVVGVKTQQMIMAVL